MLPFSPELCHPVHGHVVRCMLHALSAAATMAFVKLNPISAAVHVVEGEKRVRSFRAQRGIKPTSPVQVRSRVCCNHRTFSICTLLTFQPRQCRTSPINRRDQKPLFLQGIRTSNECRSCSWSFQCFAHIFKLGRK